MESTGSTICHSAYPKPAGIGKNRRSRIGSQGSISISAFFSEAIGDRHIQTLASAPPLAVASSQQARESDRQGETPDESALAQALQQHFLFNTSPVRARRVTKMLQRSKPPMKPLVPSDASQPSPHPSHAAGETHVSPSATLADADKLATAITNPGFREASTKRQGIIIPGEFDTTSGSARPGRDTPACAVSAIDTSPLLMQQAQADGVVDHLATPTDSNPERSASLDGVGSTGNSVASVFPLKSTPIGSSELPTLPRRRTPLKLSSSASYCCSSPPAYGTPPLFVDDVLRRTRSQSPTPQTRSIIGSMTPAVTASSSSSSTVAKTRALAKGTVSMRLLHNRRSPSSSTTAAAPPPPPPLSSSSYESAHPHTSTHSSSPAASYSTAMVASASDAGSLPSPQMHASDLVSVALATPPTSSGICHSSISNPWSGLATTESASAANGSTNEAALSCQSAQLAAFGKCASAAVVAGKPLSPASHSNDVMDELSDNPILPNSGAALGDSGNGGSDGCIGDMGTLGLMQPAGALLLSSSAFGSNGRPESSIIMVAATVENSSIRSAPCGEHSSANSMHTGQAAEARVGGTPRVGNNAGAMHEDAPATRLFMQPEQSPSLSKPPSPRPQPTLASAAEAGSEVSTSRSNSDGTGSSRGRQSSGTGSGTNSSARDQVSHYEVLMLRAQEQRNAAMAEANALQMQLDELQRTSDEAIGRLKDDLESTTRKLCIEYELRTAAETKCALMECELAELSSHIQFEAQNLVAQERREHKDELERMVRKQAEIVQLMDMEREQVVSLKQSLESANIALDKERSEAERLRSGMLAFERQVSTLISPADAAARDSALSERTKAGSVVSLQSEDHGSDPAHKDRLPSAIPSAASSSESISLAHQSLSLGRGASLASVAPPAQPAAHDPHIAGTLYFGNDATRPDTRLTEFLGFINVSSDKEALQCTFMQRSMREDVGPTLVADSTSGMPSISGWHKHRRLLHAVQENTLILESFSPRMKLSRVLSLGCYLCSCSISRPSGSSPPSTISDRIPSSSSSGGNSDVLQVQPPRQRSPMYRMRFNDNDEDNKPLCHHCHGRMVAVCSFFAYLKIVRKGLIKRPIADIWLEVNRARLQMWLARSGASPDSGLAVVFN
ncbi:hypothetical protein GQ54DRAFT_331725 [Martensiomyces pterosporus]|nr:hypothetical protein GQ54DRAFT_331725 [Martensiomyces pterosporus]